MKKTLMYFFTGFIILDNILDLALRFLEKSTGIISNENLVELYKIWHSMHRITDELFSNIFAKLRGDHFYPEYQYSMLETLLYRFISSIEFGIYGLLLGFIVYKVFSSNQKLKHS